MTSAFRNKLWLAAAFLLPLAVYLYTLFPTVTSEDSGELITAAYFLGIPHPPGYPLFMLVSKIGTILIPFGNIAWRVNAVTAIFAALTCMVMFLLVQKATKSSILGMVSALLLAFTNIFWSQAVRAEVYSLASFFLILLVYLAYKWTETEHKMKRRKLLLIFAFLIGLGSSAHQYIMVTIPAFAVYFLSRDRNLWKDYKLILNGVLFYLLGLAVFLYLPFRSAANPVMDWGNPENWHNFWRVFWRSDYGGLAGGGAQAVADGAVDAEGITEKLAAIQSLVVTKGTFIVSSLTSFAHFIFKTLLVDFIVVPFAAGVIGFFALWRKNRGLWWLITILGAWVGFFFSYFISFGDEVSLLLQFIRIPFVIPFLVLFVVFIPFGFKWFYESALKAPQGKGLRAGLAVIVLVLPVILAVWNFQANNQRGNYMIYDYVRALMNEVPKNGILYLHHGDNTIFPAGYLYHVEKFRPDLSVYARTISTIFPYNDINKLVEIKRKPVFVDMPFPVMQQDNTLLLGFVTQVFLPGSLSEKTIESIKKQAISYSSKVTLRGIDSPGQDFFHLLTKGYIMFLKGIMYYESDPEKTDQYMKEMYTAYPGEPALFAKMPINYFYYRVKDKLRAIPHMLLLNESGQATIDYNFTIGLIYTEYDDFAKAEEYMKKVEAANPQLLISARAYKCVEGPGANPNSCFISKMVRKYDEHMKGK